VWFLFGDFGAITKAAVVLMTVTSLCLQWLPGPAAHVHFLIPLSMQLFVCIWWYFARALE
jgi:hypothetical protein